MDSKIDLFANQQLEDIEKNLATKDVDLQRIHEIIVKSIQEEELITKKLKESSYDKSRTFGEKISDKVAAFGGSWSFIIMFIAIMAIWISINIMMGIKAFDQYPFILLNLILSTVAALQAPVIMMSQNRKESKDRQRAENDYMVNLKSEIGINMMNEKIDLLIVQEMDKLFLMQQEQIILLKQLREEFTTHAKNSIK